MEILNIIWKDMITSPYICILGLFIFIIIVFKSVIIKYLESILLSRKFKKTNYTIVDLKKHPIFVDLDYWLNAGISILQVNTSLGKELIMKDLLAIKYEMIKTRLLRILQEEVTDTTPLEDLKHIVISNISEYNADQVLKWKADRIPEKFIRKYVALQMKSIDLIKGSINVILDKNITTTNCTRLYLLLSLLRNHLTTTYTNAVSVVLSLNGDLNGIMYKGVEVKSGHSEEENV